MPQEYRETLYNTKAGKDQKTLDYLKKHEPNFTNSQLQGLMPKEKAKGLMDLARQRILSPNPKKIVRGKEISLKPEILNSIYPHEDNRRGIVASLSDKTILNTYLEGKPGTKFPSTDSLQIPFIEIESKLDLPKGVLFPLMMAESEQWILDGEYPPRSDKGAEGPFQLMPGVFPNVNRDNILDSALKGGLEFKRDLKNFDGDIDMALTSYNLGYGNFGRGFGFDRDKVIKEQKRLSRKKYPKKHNKYNTSETEEHSKRFHKYYDPSLL
ncbi:uncharacterized protein METZ01_LOCUS200313, partial [marine metagenome]